MHSTLSKGTTMNLRRLISIGLLISSACLQSAIAGPTINGISLDIYQTHWHAVKDIFITQPQETAGQSIWPIAPAAIGAAVAGVAAWYYFDPIIQLINSNLLPAISSNYHFRMDEKTKSMRIAETPCAVTKLAVGSPALTLLATIGATVGGWKSINWLCRTPSRKAAERKQMELVMDSWKQVRSHFPEELHAAFDTLYQLKTQESPNYTANVDKTIRFAQDSVRKHFSKPLMSIVFHTVNRMEVQSAH